MRYLPKEIYWLVGGIKSCCYYAGCCALFYESYNSEIYQSLSELSINLNVLRENLVNNFLLYGKVFMKKLYVSFLFYANLVRKRMKAR